MYMQFLWMMRFQAMSINKSKYKTLSFCVMISSCCLSSVWVAHPQYKDFCQYWHSFAFNALDILCSISLEATVCYKLHLQSNVPRSFHLEVMKIASWKSQMSLLSLRAPIGQFMWRTLYSLRRCDQWVPGKISQIKSSDTRAQTQ